MHAQINITISDRAEPVRRRVTIPRSDAVTQAWWNAQRDPSTSVRLLILEEAAAHGIVDRVNRVGIQPQAVPVTVHSTTNGASSSPFAFPAPAAATGPSGSTISTDPRDLENELLRAELDAYRRAHGPTPPLFDIGAEAAPQAA